MRQEADCLENPFKSAKLRDNGDPAELDPVFVLDSTELWKKFTCQPLLVAFSKTSTKYSEIYKTLSGLS